MTEKNLSCVDRRIKVVPYNMSDKDRAANDMIVFFVPYKIMACYCLYGMKNFQSTKADRCKKPCLLVYFKLKDRAAYGPMHLQISLNSTGLCKGRCISMTAKNGER